MKKLITVNGTWYAFGFVIGSGGWGFLGGHGASRTYKKKFTDDNRYQYDNNK